MCVFQVIYSAYVRYCDGSSLAVCKSVENHFGFGVSMSYAVAKAISLVNGKPVGDPLFALILRS